MRIATRSAGQRGSVVSLATRTHMRIATLNHFRVNIHFFLATRTHMRIATAKMHNTTTRRVRKCRAFRTWIPSLTRFERNQGE